MQDRACRYSITTAEGVKVDALFLADGHGSDCHYRSDIGATLALEAASEALPYIIEIIERRLNVDTDIEVHRGVAEPDCPACDATPVDPVLEASARLFFLRINTLWAKKVLAHWNSAPTESHSLAGVARAYGCTILGAFRTDRYWFAFQLGDGAVTALTRDGVAVDPVPDDSRCRLESTTSLCRQGARDYRYAYGTHIPPALMLCSDGLEECYSDHRALSEQFLAGAAISLVEKGYESMSEEIETVLPEFSKAYTGDDMSVALWLDSEALTPLIPLFKEQNIEYARENIAQTDAQLDDCNKTIAELEQQIKNLRNSSLDDAENTIIRKGSVLATLKRRQRELIEHLDSLNLDLENQLQ